MRNLSKNVVEMPGAKFVEKCCQKFLSLRMLSKNSVESQIRQSFSTIFDILSFFQLKPGVSYAKFVIFCRKNLSKKLVESCFVEKTCRKMLSQCQMLSKCCRKILLNGVELSFAVEKQCRKILQNILVEQECRKILSNLVSTTFLDILYDEPGRLPSKFVDYRLNIMSKNLVEI